MSSVKKPSLTRDDAKALYDDLQKNMELLKARKNGAAAQQGAGKITDDAAKELAKEISAALKSDKSEAFSGFKGGTRTAASGTMSASSSRPVESRSRSLRESSHRGGAGALSEMSSMRMDKRGGTNLALSLIAFFAIAKLTTGIIDYSGIFKVEEAQASMVVSQPVLSRPAQTGPNVQYSQQEVQILTSLDARRAELEARSQQLGEREKELETRDREFGTRVAELRELTGKLKTDREKTEKKQSTQLVQLANVYNSMNPNEAAQLLDQLDVMTALSLVERMSEKRIGQILPLMSPERALAITKMLSGRAMVGQK